MHLFQDTLKKDIIYGYQHAQGSHILSPSFQEHHLRELALCLMTSLEGATLRRQISVPELSLRRDLHLTKTFIYFVTGYNLRGPALSHQPYSIYVPGHHTRERALSPKPHFISVPGLYLRGTALQPSHILSIFLETICGN